MRSVYLLCYDVADPKRLRRTYKKMRGFGVPLQFSVFRCELSAIERQQMKAALWEILNWNEDRVILVNLGPVGARGDQCLEYWGPPRVQPPKSSAWIV